MAVAIARDEDKTAGLDPTAATEAISYRKSFLQERTREDEERKRQQRGTTALQDDLSDEDERTSFLKRRSSTAPSVIGRPRNLSINPLTPSSLFDKSYKSRFSSERLRLEADSRGERDEPEENVLPPEDTQGRGGSIQYLRQWRAQGGKKISVPVRIEPKVYFAAERTFLVSFPRSTFPTSSCSFGSRGGYSSQW